MFAILAPTDPSPTRRFVFAAFYFLMGLLAFIAVVRGRGRVKWTGGAHASLATRVLIILFPLVWGTVSLGAGLGWKFCSDHELPLKIVPMAAVAASFGIDQLRHSRSRLRP